MVAQELPEYKVAGLHLVLVALHQRERVLHAVLADQAHHSAQQHVHRERLQCAAFGIQAGGPGDVFCMLGQYRCQLQQIRVLEAPVLQLEEN